MGPTWVLSAPDGLHVGPMNLAIRDQYMDRIRTDVSMVEFVSWWRNQMETFSALLALCAGNSPVSGEFPAQRPVTRSFDVFFDLRLIKRLSKHSRGWWFGTLSRPLWRHCNGCLVCIDLKIITLVQLRHRNIIIWRGPCGGLTNPKARILGLICDDGNFRFGEDSVNSEGS